MYIFLWENVFWDKSRTRIIIFIASVIVFLTGIIFGIVELAGIVRQETVHEQLSQESNQTPFAEMPLVTYVVGYPELKKDTDTWELIETGDKLDPGSVIRTDETSFLDIRIQPGSVIRVSENTSFTLATFYQEKVELDVENGMVLARIKRLLESQSFDFRTPSTVAGIRGTELIVSAATQGTTVFGMSGKIEVFNPEIPDRKVIVGLEEKSFVQDGGEPTAALAMSSQEIILYRKLLDSMRENLSYFVNNKISFLPDSVQLTPEAYIEVEAIYKQLKSIQGNITIVGHTADIGTADSQIEISKDRARAVMDYLITLGIPASRLSAVGLGSTQPVSYDDDSLDKNRRVEFIIE